MRWLVRLAFPALGLLLALIFFGINDPGGRVQPNLESMDGSFPSFEGEVPLPLSTEGPAVVFKWQDTDGNWHYADQPPAQGSWDALALDSTSDSPFLPITEENEEKDLASPYSAPFSLDGERSPKDS
jgi:hypothetical protein